MKSSKVKFQNILLVLLPALVWISIIKARPHITTLTCIESPDICDESQVNPLDRIYIHLNDETAHEVSHWTQNTAGAIAVLTPLVLHSKKVFLAGLSWPAALAAYGADFYLLLKTVAWNGMFVEVARITVQRPRPHVYDDSHISGLNPSHYTSFYSGHTSFAACISLALFFVLLRRRVSPRITNGLLSVGMLLTVSTAILRVVAGRHFISDVTVGLVAGLLVAYGVYHLTEKKHETL